MKLTHLEIRKMVEFVQSLDIGTNPEPAAIFDPLIQGFNIWAIPSDHPKGWDKVVPFMDKGAYSKRCEYVGCAFYYPDEGIKVSTDAYAFQDHFPKEYGGYNKRNKSIHNRPEDIEWVIEKVEWVFKQINLPCPEIVVGEDD